MKLPFISTLPVLSCTALLACSVSSLAADVHTMHNITAENGQWKGRLVLATANEAGYFTNADGQKTGSLVDFTLTQQAPYVFGFGFSFPGTDFDVSYTLTLVKTSAAHALSPMFASPSCQFNVSAKGPANPDVRVEAYNGAECHYTVTGHGEDFKVS